MTGSGGGKHRVKSTPTSTGFRTTNNSFRRITRRTQSKKTIASFGNPSGRARERPRKYRKTATNGPQKKVRVTKVSLLPESLQILKSGHAWGKKNSAEQAPKAEGERRRGVVRVIGAMVEGQAASRRGKE